MRWLLAAVLLVGCGGEAAPIGAADLVNASWFVAGADCPTELGFRPNAYSQSSRCGAGPVENSSGTWAVDADMLTLAPLDTTCLTAARVPVTVPLAKLTHATPPGYTPPLEGVVYPLGCAHQ